MRVSLGAELWGGLPRKEVRGKRPGEEPAELQQGSGPEAK